MGEMYEAISESATVLLRFEMAARNDVTQSGKRFNILEKLEVDSELSIS